jgi:hypothetical protein
MCARNRLPPCPEKTIRSHFFVLAYQLGRATQKKEWVTALYAPHYNLSRFDS